MFVTTNSTYLQFQKVVHLVPNGADLYLLSEINGVN